MISEDMLTVFLLAVRSSRYGEGLATRCLLPEALLYCCLELQQHHPSAKLCRMDVAISFT